MSDQVNDTDEETINTPRDSNNDEWKKYHKDLEKKLLFERVRDATASRNKERLEQCLAECQENDLTDHKDVRKGQFVLDVVSQKESLDEAIRSMSIRNIKGEINEIETKSGRFQRELQQDVINANTVIDQIRRGKRPQNNHVLPMDRKTMSEIRRYANPPKKMHRILQAALLLMGEDEYTTSDWKRCMQLLNPQGRAGMNRKVLEFNHEEIHPEICATVKYILTEEQYDSKNGYTIDELKHMYGKKYAPSEDYQDKYWKTYDLSTIQSVSPAAATFYVWAMGIIDDFENANGDSGAEPANLRRQLEILNRRPKPTETPRLSPYARRKYPRNSDRYVQKETKNDAHDSFVSYQ